MDTINNTKKYRKNEWRKKLSFLGDRILYEWRPASRGYFEVKSKYFTR